MKRMFSTGTPFHVSRMSFSYCFLCIFFNFPFCSLDFALVFSLFLEFSFQFCFFSNNFFRFLLIFFHFPSISLRFAFVSFHSPFVFFFFLLIFLNFLSLYFIFLSFPVRFFSWSNSFSGLFLVVSSDVFRNPTPVFSMTCRPNWIENREIWT